jgi:heme exporter protein B
MQLLWAFQKEALLQWRTRAQIVSIFLFAAISLLMFSFAAGPNAASLRIHAAGFLWLALLLSSTLTLLESFQSEMEERALEGLLLLPVSAPAIYYAKAIANALQLTLLGAALLPLIVVLYNAPAQRLGPLLGVVVAGAAGISAPGTLYAAMASQIRARQMLLPLLLFPLVVPVLLASVKATSLFLLGDPMGQARSWVTLLIAFDVIYWSLCGLLFERVIEE